MPGPRRASERRPIAITVGAIVAVASLLSFLALAGRRGESTASPPTTEATDDAASARRVAVEPSATSTSTTTTSTTTTSPPPSTEAPTTTRRERKAPRPDAGSPTEPPAAPAPGASLMVRDGKFIVDGDERALVGVNASGAASALVVGSPCGYPDVDLDLMFSVLPQRSLVRVWFTQRMVTNLGTGERYWEPIDAVIDAAERSPSKPLILATLATGAGDCDGGHWRNRSWYDGGYRGAPEPGMPDSYAGWVDEIVSRYADRPVVAVWEPVNEPDPSTCLPGHDGSGCFGHTRCDAGAAESLAGFLDTVGARIHELDPGSLVSDGGGGWCGWGSMAERLTVEGTPNVDIISVHDYHLDDQPVPDWMNEALERARRLRKPLLVGEVGIGAGPNGGGRSVTDRADLLAAKVQEQIAAGAGAVLLWVYGGFDQCGYCIAPTDPVMQRLQAFSLR